MAKISRSHREMKIIVLIFVFSFTIVINGCKSDGVRTFYCLSEDKCVTVWKRTDGKVYITPGRYESNNKPAVSHIQTINKQFLTLYFSNEKKLSYKIIVRDEGNLESNLKSYTIENDVKGEWEFLEYSDNYKSILYEPNAIKFKDVKTSTDYLTINIQENYATDKTGKIIE